jgi:hypothetical protein
MSSAPIARIIAHSAPWIVAALMVVDFIHVAPHGLIAMLNANAAPQVAQIVQPAPVMLAEASLPHSP